MTISRMKKRLRSLREKGFTKKQSRKILEKRIERTQQRQSTRSESNPRMIPIWASIYFSAPTYELSLHARKKLLAFPPRLVLPHLVRYSKSEHVNVREQSFALMGELGDFAAFPYLKKALTSGKHYYSAVEWLCHLDDRRVVPTIIEAIQETDGEAVCRQRVIQLYSMSKRIATKHDHSAVALVGRSGIPGDDTHQGMLVLTAIALGKIKPPGDTHTVGEHIQFYRTLLKEANTLSLKELCRYLHLGER